MNFTNFVRSDRSIGFDQLLHHCRQVCEILTWLHVESSDDKTITVSEPEFQVAIIMVLDEGAELKVTHTGGFFFNSLANSLEADGYQLEIA